MKPLRKSVRLANLDGLDFHAAKGSFQESENATMKSNESLYFGVEKLRCWASCFCWMEENKDILEFHGMLKSVDGEGGLYSLARRMCC